MSHDVAFQPRYRMYNGALGFMTSDSFSFFRRLSLRGLFLLGCFACEFQAHALPTGGVVKSGNGVTIATSGSTLTITQPSATSASLINWSTFNIASGETVNFTLNAPGTPVSWNFISDQNASTLAGALNANKGLIILQNPNGFSIAGTASINVHNLVMTTSVTPPTSVTAAGPWTFSAPAPTAQIVNYGQITTSGGGSVYLIASDIVNNGTITAPSGSIGLYDGETILVSKSATGQGLSAAVTLPAGSVDNEGNLVANGGTIAAMAQYVNQNGVVQANTAVNVNGTVELVASSTLNLGASSSIQAANLTVGAPAITTPSGNINLAASGNIEINTSLTLPDSATPLSLNLSAGNNITFDSGVDVLAGQNWSVTLDAGTAFAGGAPTSGNDGIYLNGNAILQTENGNINLWAANEVILGNGAVRTIGGGNINVTAQYGGVNTGSGAFGFNFNANATGPFYSPSASLSGISTAAGGNVNITAGGNVTSYSTLITSIPANFSDPGTGAFGSQPGNVTINAGGSVSGNFVVINGAGIINAGQDIGSALGSQVALNLANNSSWTLNAGWNPFTQSVQNGVGNIYLQEARNPNGIFNNKETFSGGKSSPAAGYHYFDYGSQASLALNAGDGVYVSGEDLPRISSADAPPMILPPVVAINAGAGGVTLDTPTATDGGSSGDVFLLDSDIILFPSPDGNLTINTTSGGSLMSGNLSGEPSTLRMSDSAQTSWYNPSVFPLSKIEPFSEKDDAGAPAQLGDAAPVTMNISGSIDNLTLWVSKLATINVGGDMINSSFYGVNLNPGDVTTLNVGGEIFNGVSFTSVSLGLGITTVPFDDLPPGAPNVWDAILSYALSPAVLSQSFSTTPQQQLASILYTTYLAFPGLNNNLVYDPSTQTLTAAGPLSLSLLNILQQPITVARYGANGFPEIDPTTGRLITDTITLLPPADNAQASTLYISSQNAPPLGVNNGVYVVGGQGYFNVNAGAISLGNSDGILSVGNGSILAVNYNNLAPYITSGATIDVNAGSLVMPASSIAALGGGDVNVNVTGVIPDDGNVSMDLGSQILEPFEGDIMNDTGIGLGIYTTGGGNVTVNSFGTIDVDSSRIATFNGGNINITSYTGDVDAGSGGTIQVPVKVFSPAYTVPQPDEYVYANGIVAETLANASAINAALQLKNPNLQGPATIPGDILINTPEGDINADLGGILQETPGQTLPAGPTVTLTAGTPNPPGDWTSTLPPLYIGNITLGQSGVIGGTVNARATGKISGLVVSSQDANIVAQTLGTITVLSGKQANVSGNGGNGQGITIIGGQGVTASGIGDQAILLSQSVSVGSGAAQSTLGNGAHATATSQSAAQQSTELAAKQVTSDTGDDEKKKKKKKAVVHIGRVTVLLSAAVPGH